MAAGEHSCTRRDVLGAAVAGAVVLRHAVSTGSTAAQDERAGKAATSLPYDRPSPSRPADALPLPQAGEGSRFARALAAVRRAEGAMRGAEGDCSAAGLAIEEVFRREEVYGDAIVAFNRALARLLAAPAPDLEALAAKPVLSSVEGIGFAADYEAVTLNGCESCLEALKADAVRLVGRSGTSTEGRAGVL